MIDTRKNISAQPPYEMLRRVEGSDMTDVFRCTNCCGNTKLDVAFLDNISVVVYCPYCGEQCLVED